MTEGGGNVFCIQCGHKLPENARFCSNCGAQVSDSETTSTSLQEISEEKTVDEKIVGALHWAVAQLSKNLAQDYVQSVMLRDLDEFIAYAERNIENVFSKMDAYFLEFLQQNDVYQFQEKHISPYTRKYVGRWLSVFNEALMAYQRITGKEQKLRQYRELRKDTRFQVVGGGFGVSGAVQGMATAGAINLTTGALHSLVNSFGNAMSEAEAQRQKSDFFYQENFSKSLELTLQLDCYSTLGGFIDLWNELDIGQIRFYSETDMEQASNILLAISEGKVPQSQIAPSLSKMISIYPVIPDVYWAAIRCLPDLKQEYLSMADRFGINLYALESHSKDAAKAQIQILFENSVFLDYVEVTRDLSTTLEYMGETYKRLIGKSFVIFSKKYAEKYNLKIKWMRDSFASYGNSETPILCIDSTWTGSGGYGLFLTDRHLFIKGDNRDEGIQTYALESIRDIFIELNPNNGCHFFRINDGAARVQAFSNRSAILEIILFFVHYCLFLRESQNYSNGDFFEDILSTFGCTEDELYELLDSQYEDREDKNKDNNRDKDGKQIIETIQELCNVFLEAHPGTTFTISKELLFEHHVGEGEKIFLGHDDTLFHSGKNGFVVTDRGIYCREMWEETVFTSYADLAHTKGEIYCKFSTIFADTHKLAYITGERYAIKDLISLFQSIRDTLN